MTTKSTFSRPARHVTGLGGREPRVQGLALPKSVESGNLSFDKAVILRMLAKIFAVGGGSHESSRCGFRRIIESGSRSSLWLAHAGFCPFPGAA
jgi:hypothetical protein